MFGRLNISRSSDRSYPTSSSRNSSYSSSSSSSSSNSGKPKLSDKEMDKYQECMMVCVGGNIDSLEKCGKNCLDIVKGVHTGVPCGDTNNNHHYNHREHEPKGNSSSSSSSSVMNNKLHIAETQKNNVISRGRSSDEIVSQNASKPILSNKYLSLEPANVNAPGFWEEQLKKVAQFGFSSTVPFSPTNDFLPMNGKKVQIIELFVFIDSYYDKKLPCFFVLSTKNAILDDLYIEIELATGCTGMDFVSCFFTTPLVQGIMRAYRRPLDNEFGLNFSKTYSSAKEKFKSRIVTPMICFKSSHNKNYGCSMNECCAMQQRINANGWYRGDFEKF